MFPPKETGQQVQDELNAINLGAGSSDGTSDSDSEEGGAESSSDEL